jgi:hypothetical protein
MPRVAEKLDMLFASAVEEMEILTEEPGGEFTSQQFIKRLAQRNQRAYVGLLWERRDRVGIFNAAHEHIGGRLSQVAQKNHNELIKQGRTEVDIFGNPTGKVIYRRRK